MRPREIQARIRAGASVDDVIVESGLDRGVVERFASPVLAERDHIITRALETLLRRDFANDVPLSDAVAERLTPHGVERSSVNWLSWRRDDGRWVIEANFVIGREQRSAHWAFDSRTSALVADDDEARWLSDPDAAEPDPAQRGRPLLAAVHSIVPRDEVAPVTSPQVIDEEELSLVEHEDVEPAEAEQLSLDDTPRPTSPAAPKRKGRASVPSWDDIVFGARPSE